MTAIPGVELKKNDKGEATHIAIDLTKNPQAIPVLKEAGLIPKTPFEIECEDTLTVDEVFDGVRQLIKDHYANRNSSTKSKG